MQVFTTEEFAEWFAGVDDRAAEDVATLLEIIEQLGSARAAPGSRESLLWYEHPSVARFDNRRSIAFELEAWGSFRDYATQILKELEAPRFVARITKLPVEKANAVLAAIARIRQATDPRNRWALRLAGVDAPKDIRVEEACAEIRVHYFAALEGAGFQVKDVPAHSLALREVARRSPEPPFRLLYGVHAEKEVALVVVGEWLDRSFYGASVRRAEGLWKNFLDGTLQPMRTP